MPLFLIQVMSQAMRSAAVIQAAGKGSRFHSGQYKLLTPVDGVPMILRTLAPVLCAGFEDVVVVIGAYEEQMRRTLADLPVRIVINTDWERGQSTSLAAGVRAVFSTGWSGKCLSSNRSVFFTEEVPHDWLFPRVSAVVHHGGAGTTASGLRYGKPSLVIPFAGDQAFWGYQVYKTGCGPKPIPRSALSVRKMTKALIALRSNSHYYENARRISGQLAKEHGVRDAADLIELEITRW